MIAIRRVESAEDFLAVARFRYRIYVEEMRRPQKDADHDAKTIIDDLDRFGCLYAAWNDGTIVGTVRSNYLRDGDIGTYFDYYALRQLPAEELPAVSITTRLMVAEHLRSSSLGVRLACATYGDGLKAGIETDFIDCNDHLVELFTGLGYRRHPCELVHPEYGAVHVLKLALRDAHHLTAIRSPFARIYRELETPKAVLAGKGAR